MNINVASELLSRLMEDYNFQTFYSVNHYLQLIKNYSVLSNFSNVSKTSCANISF